LFNRDFLDEIGREVEAKYGIPFNNIMLSGTNNHSAPVQTIWSDKSADQAYNISIKKAIMEAIGLANEKLKNAGEMDCYFALGDATIGQNSRLVMIAPYCGLRLFTNSATTGQQGHMIPSFLYLHLKINRENWKLWYSIIQPKILIHLLIVLFHPAFMEKQHKKSKKN
jgi:hypothetical protein